MIDFQKKKRTSISKSTSPVSMLKTQICPSRLPPSSSVRLAFLEAQLTAGDCISERHVMRELGGLSSSEESPAVSLAFALPACVAAMRLIPAHMSVPTSAVMMYSYTSR